jgi:hypothetical protein
MQKKHAMKISRKKKIQFRFDGQFFICCFEDPKNIIHDRINFLVLSIEQLQNIVLVFLLEFCHYPKN